MGKRVKGPMRRAAEVLREYATMIEESEIHRSGPLNGKCAPAIQEEIDEYRGLATALEADGWIPIADKMPDDDITVMVACKDTDEPVWFGYHDADGWYGSRVLDRNDAGFDGCDARAWPLRTDGCDPDVEHEVHGYRENYQGADCRIRLVDRAGADPAEWPKRLRVQEFPA